MRGFDPGMFDDEDPTQTDPGAMPMATQELGQSLGLDAHLQPVPPKEMQMEPTEYGISQPTESGPLDSEQEEAIQMALKEQLVRYKQKLKADQEKALLNKDMQKMQPPPGQPPPGQQPEQPQQPQPQQQPPGALDA